MSTFPEILLLVMPGLDPGIHQNKNENALISDGLPGQARQ
jgi:hypothetical protein